MTSSCLSNAVSKRFVLCGQEKKKHSAFEKAQPWDWEITQSQPPAPSFPPWQGLYKAWHQQKTASQREDHSGD